MVSKVAISGSMVAAGLIAAAVSVWRAHKGSPELTQPALGVQICTFWIGLSQTPWLVDSVTHQKYLDTQTLHLSFAIWGFFVLVLAISIEMVRARRNRR